MTDADRTEPAAPSSAAARPRERTFLRTAAAGFVGTLAALAVVGGAVAGWRALTPTPEEAARQALADTAADCQLEGVPGVSLSRDSGTLVEISIKAVDGRTDPATVEALSCTVDRLLPTWLQERARRGHTQVETYQIAGMRVLLEWDGYARDLTLRADDLPKWAR